MAKAKKKDCENLGKETVWAPSPQVISRLREYAKEYRRAMNSSHSGLGANGKPIIAEDQWHLRAYEELRDNPSITTAEKMLARVQKKDRRFSEEIAQAVTKGGILPKGGEVILASFHDALDKFMSASEVKHLEGWKDRTGELCNVLGDHCRQGQIPMLLMSRLTGRMLPMLIVAAAAMEIVLNARQQIFWGGRSAKPGSNDASVWPVRGSVQ